MSSKVTPGAGDGPGRGRVGVLGDRPGSGSSGSRHQQILETAFDFVLGLDLEGRLTYLNRTVKGISAEDALGTSVIDWTHPDDVPKVLDVIRRVRETSRACEYEVRARGDEGSTSHYLCRMAPQIVDGRVDALTVCATDITELVHKEEALEEAKALLTAVFNHSPVGMLVTDAEGTVTMVNPTAMRIRGEEVSPPVDPTLAQTGWAILDVDSETPIPHEATPLGRALLHGVRSTNVELIIRRPSGEHRWVLASTSPIGRSPERPAGAIAVFQDITEWKRAESELVQLSDFYRAALEGSLDAFYVLRSERNEAGEITDFSIVDVNKRGEQRLGKKRDELIGRRVRDLFHIYRDEASFDRYRQVALTGVSLEEDLLIPPDQPFAGWYSRQVVPLSDGIAIMSRDITERRKQEEALRGSEQRYRDIVETAQEGIWVLDAGSKTSFTNARMAEMLGTTREEMAGRHIFAFMDEDARSLAYELLARCRAGVSEVHELRFLRRDGGAVWTLVSTNPLRDEDGGYVGALAMVMDVTERKKAAEEAQRHQDELARADKLITLGTLVASAAHEINNPNYVISLNLPTLRDVLADALPVLDAHHADHPDFTLGGLPYDEMRREVMQLVDQSISGSERIKRFVAELRRFSRGEAMASPMRETDVGEVVESAVTLLAGQIRKATNRFHVRYAESLPRVLGDPGGLEQVVINVILNACQSLTSRKQGVWVETGCVPDRTRVTVTVRDEGCGIPEEDLRRVHEPFFTTRRDAGGTGLGLAVSIRILDRHRGTLSFESAVGKGTVATISLPVAGEAS